MKRSLAHSSYRLSSSLVVALALFLTAACNNKGAPLARNLNKQTEKEKEKTKEEDKKTTKADFKNPGGMWLPDQVAGQEDILKGLGVEIESKQFADLLGYPMGAIIQIPGCSAAFVSDKGLLVTNHHCARPAINRNNSKFNIRDNGYLAKSYDEELSYGPTGRVYINQKFEDVTPAAFQGSEHAKTQEERYNIVDKNVKALTKECEKTPNTRCQVVSFFKGEKFVRFYQLEIQDLRLVYTPPFSVGFYGGDIDNWRWPRETGDFAFFRAYVGKDGKPAAYNKDNVPYQPAQHLKPASKPLTGKDFAMVAGFPGATNRYSTLEEIKEAATYIYPDTVQRYKEYIAVIDAVVAANGGPNSEIGNRAGDRLMSLNNYLINYEATLDGFQKQHVVAQKEQEKAALQAWIQADASRKAKYGEVINRLENLYKERSLRRNSDGALLELLVLGIQVPPVPLSVAGPGNTLLATALLIVRTAHEKQKPDGEREPGYQERDYPNLKSRLLDFTKVYDRKLDEALMKKAFERTLKRDGGSNFLAGPLNRPAPNLEFIEKDFLPDFYDHSLLANEAERMKLFAADTATLEKSSDPAIQLALNMKHLVLEYEQRQKSFQGEMLELGPSYIKALREFKGKDLAPDANRSLRLTYGTVRGYAPTPEAEVFKPFSLLPDLIKKSAAHQNKDPFEVSPRLEAAFKAKKFGHYAQVDGQVPVNYLSDLDITGGNSGSSTINGKGEWIGLVFDGNYEGVASNWLFLPEVTRAIHVDARFILWNMDAVDGAHHLMKEMGYTPEFEHGDLATKAMDNLPVAAP